MNAWFSIECNNEIVRNITLRGKYGDILYKDIMLASPEELNQMSKDGSGDFDDFIFDIFHAANSFFGTESEDVTIHLTDHYGILIWSMAMHKNNPENIDYQIFDQRQDGKFRRITSDGLTNKN